MMSPFYKRVIIFDNATEANAFLKELECPADYVKIHYAVTPYDEYQSQTPSILIEWQELREQE
jgi:hypothetical protein